MNICRTKGTQRIKGAIFNSASILGGGQGVGEAGAEAVIPIQHKRYMVPFANAVAQHMNSLDQKSGNETTIENTFVMNGITIREESDIKEVARELYDLQKRKNRSR